MWWTDLHSDRASLRATAFGDPRRLQQRYLSSRRGCFFSPDCIYVAHCLYIAVAHCFTEQDASRVASCVSRFVSESGSAAQLQAEGEVPLVATVPTYGASANVPKVRKHPQKSIAGIVPRHRRLDRAGCITRLVVVALLLMRRYVYSTIIRSTVRRTWSPLPLDSSTEC